MISFHVKLIAIFLLNVFLLFAGCEITHRESIVTVWHKDLSIGSNHLVKFYQNQSTRENVLPFFKFPTGFAYVSNEGETQFTYKLETDNEQYSVSAPYYLLYHEKPEKGKKSVGKLITVFSSSGEPIRIKSNSLIKRKKNYPMHSILSSAFPRVSPQGEFIVLFESGGMSFSMLNKKGDEIVPNITYGALITTYSFSHKSDHFAIGYINGHIALYDKKGKELFNKRIQTGKHNVIKSIFLSDNGEYVGVIAGLYSEEVQVYNRSGKLLWREQTGFNQRTNVTGAFSGGDARRVIIGIPGGAAVYSNSDGSLITRLQFAIPDTRSFFLFDADGSNDSSIVLSFSTKEKSYLFVLNRYGALRKRWVFPDKYLYTRFSSAHNTLIIQGDKNAFCFDLRTEE